MENSGITGKNEVSEKKFYSLLGLSQRGGHMASGEFMTEKAVKEGRAFLCIVAEDSSEYVRVLPCPVLLLFR